MQQHRLGRTPRELPRELADHARAALELRDPGGVDVRRARARARALNLRAERDQRRAVAGDRAPAEQIRGLDAGRALVDRVELLIAQPRFG